MIQNYIYQTHVQNLILAPYVYWWLMKNCQSMEVYVFILLNEPAGGGPGASQQKRLAENPQSCVHG